MQKKIFLKALKTELESHKNAKDAASMSKYLRNKFDHYGIRSKPRKDILSAVLKVNDLPANTQSFKRLIKDIWNLKEREYQHCALDILIKTRKRHNSSFLDLYEHLITHKSWWDTVDNISSHVGYSFQQYPNEREAYLIKWRDSQDFWLRRVCILFQLKYKKQTDVKLLEDIILENQLKSEFGGEFFIQKAIGWILREYAKTDSDFVKKFVKKYKDNLSNLSVREALKHM